MNFFPGDIRKFLPRAQLKSEIYISFLSPLVPNNDLSSYSEIRQYRIKPKWQGVDCGKRGKNVCRHEARKGFEISDDKRR